MRIASAFVATLLTTSGCVTVAPPAAETPAAIQTLAPASLPPQPMPSVTIATPAPAAATVPAEQPAGDVEMLVASDDLTGERMFTLGDTAIVEHITELTLRQAERGDSLSALPPPAGATAYTFLVSFYWDGTEEGPFELGSSYYNAINFTLRDDQGFEYPVLQGGHVARQPEMRFGDLLADQQVQGWLTFYGSETAPYVELKYAPIADDPVFFRVEPAS